MVSIDADELASFTEELLGAVGAEDDIAAKVADSLVTANVRGHNSHGVRRIPSYTELIEGERDDAYTLDPTAYPTVESKGPTAATVDGQFAFGQLVGRDVVDTAVEKAEEHGMATVGVRDATHLGRIGEWSERAAEAGMIFGAWVNGQGPGPVAAAGSASRLFITNPISFGIPTFDALDFPIVLDIATSQVAEGKFNERWAKGEPLHEEWTVTANGDSVTDPDAFYDGEGAMLPLGGRVSGYKGTGLAVIAELFAGITSDGYVAGQTDRIRGNAAMFMAIDPLQYTTQERIEDRITAVEAHIRSAEYSPNIPVGVAAYGDEYLLPGEAEYRITNDHLENGAYIADEDAAELAELAREYGAGDAAPPSFANLTVSGD